MLVEKDEKLEYASTGVAWEEKGVARGECRGYAV